jgi:4-hydroxybenzoate polyprenyltransferase
MSNMRTLRVLLDNIRFEHTIFALPFAYLGMVLAARGLPAWSQILWVTLAMAGARTLAMSVNRVIDAAQDARNPRTAGRPIPTGKLSAVNVWLLSLVSLVILLVAAWQLNDLCLRLAPLAAAVLVIYPYTKRFTWLSHWVLGLADAIAPVGGWIAVTAAFAPETILLGAAVGVWITGFDLIYACQDVDFDRREGLYSIPAQFGVAASLNLSTLMHVLTALLLAAVGITMGLAWPFWAGWLAACALLTYEHRLVSPADLSRLDMAFFNVNGYIAIVVFAGTLASIYLR